MRARELRQRAVARGKEIHEMACKCGHGEYLFHQPCGLCNISTTHKPFSELMLNFPDAHHEGDQDCTVQDLVEHHCLTQHIPDYQCDLCNVRGLAKKVTVITECPSILCVVLCRKKKNGGSITSAVQFPMSDFKIAEEGLRYNLIGTVHHYLRTTDNGHYTSICKSQQSRQSGTWFSYNDDQVRTSHFTNKKKNNQVLKKFMKSVIFFFMSVMHFRQRLGDRAL